MLRRPDLGPEVVETFVADISERVHARQRLEQLNAELERRVLERTEALQNANVDLRYQIEEREKVERELVVAKDEAEEANRSKDKYLAAASHDLLQPLNAARLMVSALQEGAEELLADLLDISKLDQQAMKPDFIHLDINELVRDLGEEFSAVAANEELDFRIRSTSAFVHTDPRMLARIVRNLLSNAFRYTRQGGVLLAVRMRDEELQLQVWDTGVGIAPEKLRDIFAEFHQVLPHGAGGRQGAGLGLAIVERMVGVLGCRIDVASKLGQGSRFTLTLSRASAPRYEKRQPPVVPPVLREGFEGALILVIDNDPAVLESMQMLLERWGCEVMPVLGREEALAELARSGKRPTVVLADYHLDDGRTGFDAIHRVRKYLGEDVPGAIITADRSDEVRTLLRAQYLPVLNKPVKPNRLRALLTSFVASSPI